jgi:cell division protein FtsB
MVIRRRLRAVLIPLALYAVSGSAASYFVWHAYNGSRGLKAKEEYRQQIAELTTRLHAIQDERAGWERRISMMSADSIDRDLLEEEARVTLGRVQKDELVLFVKKPAL